MKDFGEIIYVVAIVASVIYSIVKKMNTQKGATPTTPSAPQDQYHPSEEEHDEMVIEDLRDLFRTREIPIKEKPKVVTTEATFNKVKPVIVHPDRKVPPKIKYKAIEEPDDSHLDWVDEEIDLRKAVIYSEILNRPYQ